MPTIINDYPKWIRVSLGSAITIGLLKSKTDVSPTTVYLMTYKIGKCNANCSFCPQARESRGRTDKLSRITWPKFPLQDVIDKIDTSFKTGKIKRVCIQAVNYREVIPHLVYITKKIKQKASIPISVSCQPLNLKNIKKLAEAGVNKIGIPLDGATSEIFDKVKGLTANGPYTWKKTLQLLKDALTIFGHGNVTTHLIVGLGETEREIIQTIQNCIDNNIYPALFAFTPIPGTTFENQTQPTIQKYRRIQIARYLLLDKKTRYENVKFNNQEEILNFGVNKVHLTAIINSGKPFLTSGCPNCNRPFYNETPSGPLYNYPRKPKNNEINKIKTQFRINNPNNQPNDM